MTPAVLPAVLPTTTTAQWPQVATAFVSAVLFGIGLVVSGMTTPSRVVGFLDVGGAFDPALALVMVGAIGVHRLAVRVVAHRQRPLWGDAFHLPRRRDIDARLVIGAALFGVGWGLSGVCPGPGLVAVVGAVVAAVGGGAETGSWSLVVFVLAMLGGMKLFGIVDTLLRRSTSA